MALTSYRPGLTVWGFLALIEALQRSLADVGAELKTFDEAGSAVRLVIRYENL